MKTRLIYALSALMMIAMMFVTSCSTDEDIINTPPPTEEQTYSINFNANGGEGNMSTQEVKKGVATALTANSFTRTDYTFSGWNTKADGTGTSYADKAKVTLSENVTLYAQWIADAATTYEVTFDANGGEGTMEKQTIEENKETALNAKTFTRTSYTFSGWNTKADGTGTSYADKAKITLSENVTLYAQWIAVAATTYEVTFDANGGEGTMEKQVIEENKETALNAKTFTRTDYTFNGWNTAADGTGTSYADGAKVTLSADVTLYAQWIANAATTYEVTFDANGGEGTMEKQTIEDNKETALNAKTFTRTNYTFNGWNTAADGTGTSYADGAKVTLSANLTLYAQWVEDVVTTYDVTFDANGGEGTMEKQIVEENKETALNAKTFTRTDYTFNGWNTAADGTGTSYADKAKVTLSENVTLYAQWIADAATTHEVTFNANGGAGTMSAQTVEENVATALNANNFNRSCYKFSGWNTAANGTGTSYANGADITLSANTTLYAQWDVDEDFIIGYWKAIALSGTYNGIPLTLDVLKAIGIDPVAFQFNTDKTGTSPFTTGSATWSVSGNELTITASGISATLAIDAISTTEMTLSCNSLTLGALGTATNVKITLEKTTPPVVTINVASVSLNKTTLTLVEGKTEALIATVNPGNATNKNVTWKSNDKTVATVENGTVKAIKAGPATITVTTEDGTKTATCNVTVVAPTGVNPPDISGGEEL